ncbi:MAG TPA: acyl-CoA reductase [Chitinophagaceae bacterium]|nr:acyl-CoA reductase [Chitinophagaceae bacterium]
MILQERINLLKKLNNYFLENNIELQNVKQKAFQENAWFIPEFVEESIKNISNEFLEENKLNNLIQQYKIPAENIQPKRIGIVMAGNIALVGFHDFLCAFITGHSVVIKPSSKDSVLIKHIVQKLAEWNSEINSIISFAEILKGCEAFIATGSNNSSRYFEYYFEKYPSIIRKNRTSVAILTGKESKTELDLLAKDIQLYFGLGCRNVTKLFVPEKYDFIPLLDALKKYDYYLEYHKYKHNYDYHLALLIMGNKLYMNNGSIVFTENESNYSPISQVHYSYYKKNEIDYLLENIQPNQEIQCIIGYQGVPFGCSQQPCITDFADGVDTIQFLINLN